MKYDFWRVLYTAFFASLLLLGGCDSLDGDDGDTGPAGATGAAGAAGTAGADGADGAGGADGADGADGEDGLGVDITDFHGTEMLLSTGDYDPSGAGKFFATVTVTAATAADDGTATVDFTIADEDGDPVSGVTGVDFSIVKLEPASGGESFNKWVPYIYRAQTVGASTATSTWPAANDGVVSYQGYRESNGTYTDNGDGSYSYTFALDLTAAVMDTTPITYDRTLTHRVTVQMGGHNGATAEAIFDFVPDGSAITETRDIVQTSVCLDCHGENDFHGHGGDRLLVEGCVTCHTTGSIDPHGGETVDMKVMIHKIHAGGKLTSIAGADGIVWDDPATTATDESADNGEYAIWGYRDSKHEWWKPVFPAVLENCTVCHTGSGADVDNWKTVMSREACGSCHDDVDFALGTNHVGGIIPDDSSCALCHQTGGIADSVVEGHDWASRDLRNTPEFDVALSVSAPANGTHFVAGESPVVTVILTDLETGLVVDHTTVVDDTDGDEGCLAAACPVSDGDFRAAYLFVHGPRAVRNPVLSTAARVEVVGGAAPYDLSAADSLDLQIDNGQAILDATNGGSRISGDISVDYDAADFVAPAAATAAEVVAWLNGDSDFAARAIAYLDEASGNPAIRSRNLGQFYALQLEAAAAAGDVAEAVFGVAVGSTPAVQVVGGYYPSNHMEQQALAADNDPMAAWTVDSMTYTLDPVDDLAAGTYVVSAEISGRGRVSTSDYKTPSVAKTTFQVKQAAEELAVANNCDSCHQGPDGTGFVLDNYRHNKLFDDAAVDQCAACHDYQNGRATGEWWGGKPISRRVHAVHYGSELNYPSLTVDYNDPVKGRNWEIHFPQDILNCETCHPSATTSGSWMTNASRLPCMGCHDDDSTAAHLKLQTFDPTPADPWSGDEEESCNTCH